MRVLLGLALTALAAGAQGLEVKDFKGKNVVIFLTDQERATQNFPPAWEERNLPGLMRLKNNGVTFKKAYTNACMCSPARSTLLSGYLPAQHGVRYTLEQAMPSARFPNVELPRPDLLPHNLATVAAAAGYEVAYKGKLHVNKPASPDYTWVPQDAAEYGFKRWNPKDAGANQSLSEAGGGGQYAAEKYGGNNDYRFMTADGSVEAGEEGALAYINNVAKRNQPFFLVISLVNPHDVLFYPSKFNESGYNTNMLSGDIQVPGSWREDLRTKPSVQKQFVRIFQLSGPITTPEEASNYVNFYGNLIKQSDEYLVQTLDALEAQGLLDDTLIIRTADHGEGGLTHGGQRQKNFNMYEQSINVPLVYSNPKLFPEPLVTDSLVSHVDLLPTLATLLSAPASARAKWEGVDYSSILLDAKAAKPVQDYVVFTYDDFQSGQTVAFTYPRQPNHVLAIHEARWKFAEYSDPSAEVTNVRSEFEMYDLVSDPEEANNLAWPGYTRSAEEEAQYLRLLAKLHEVRVTQLAPIPLARPVSLNAIVNNTLSAVLLFVDEGPITGVPMGATEGQGGGNPPQITLTYALHPLTNTATAHFVIASPIGLIYGEIAATFTTSASAGAGAISFNGTAGFLSGTGAFRGITAEGLAFSDTKSLDGQNGQVSIKGTAFY